MVRGRRNPLHYKLPERLRRARESADVTATGLSLSAGLSRAMVYRLEGEGRVPALDVIELLARALGVSPGWLAFGLESETVIKAGEDMACAGLGGRLRALRESRGLSFRALAEAAQITHTTARLSEEGQTVPSVATAESLAKALGVSPAWLAYGEGAQILPKPRREARKG